MSIRPIDTHRKRGPFKAQNSFFGGAGAAYMTDEAKEGRNAFLEKRKPNFEKKWIP